MEKRGKDIIEKVAYQPAELSWWQGRVDGVDKLYWHQHVQLLHIHNDVQINAKHTAALLGYKSDVGAILNKGRAGAVDGPSAIRNKLASISWHYVNARVFDAGNLCNKGEGVEDLQHYFAKKIGTLLSHNIFPIGLGGSHDMALGSFMGLASYLPENAKIGIINIDAHLDLRIPNVLPNSGTPFYQISMLCNAKNTPFFYLPIGIQPAANNAILLDTAQKLNVQWIDAANCNPSSIVHIMDAIDALAQQVDAIYLSIDLDGISSAWAPGVSAPSPMGISVETCTKLIAAVIATKKLKVVDIAELNPLYDVDDQTALLAARLIDQLVLQHVD